MRLRRTLMMIDVARGKKNRTFSRSIILPTDVKTEDVVATLKNGVLAIILPKAQKARLIKVKELDS